MQSPAGVLTTPDSLNYLDLARNIDQGHGALSTNRSLQANASGENTFPAQRLWPKLYPIVLSAFVDNSYSSKTIRPLSILLLTFSMTIAFVIVKRYSSNVIAFFAAIMLAHTLPITTVYAYVWSETLFIPLLLLFSYAVLRYSETLREQQATSYLWITLLSLSLLGLALTRYIGIGMAVLLPFLLLH